MFPSIAESPPRTRFGLGRVVEPAKSSPLTSYLSPGEQRKERIDENNATLLEESVARWESAGDENHGLAYVGSDRPIRGFFAQPNARHNTPYNTSVARLISAAAYDYARPISVRAVQGRTEIQVQWCGDATDDWPEECDDAYKKLFNHFTSLVTVLQGRTNNPGDRRFAFIGNDDPSFE